MDRPDSTNERCPELSPPTRLSLIAPPRYFCVSCRKRKVTIDHGRCVNCQDEPMRGCGHCAYDLSAEIEYEVASRWKAASSAVNDAWVSQDMFGRYRLRERVLAARKSER